MSNDPSRATTLSMSRENCCARNADIARSTPRSGIPDLITKKAAPSPAASPAYGGAAPAVKPRGDEECIRESGCEAYLSKPVPVAQFVETIRRFLGVSLSIPAR